MSLPNELNRKLGFVGEKCTVRKGGWGDAERKKESELVNPMLVSL